MIKKYILFAVLCVHTVAPQLKAVTAEQYAAGGTIAALAMALTAGTTWGLKRRARLRKIDRLRRAMIARAVRRGDKAPDTRRITLAPSTIERMAPYILALALTAAGAGGVSTALLHKKAQEPDNGNGPLGPPLVPPPAPLHVPPHGPPHIIDQPGLVLPPAPGAGVEIHPREHLAHLMENGFIRLTPPGDLVEGVWQLSRRNGNLMLCPVQGQIYQEPIDRHVIWNIGLQEGWLVDPSGSGQGGGGPDGPPAPPMANVFPLPARGGPIVVNQVYTFNGKLYKVLDLGREDEFQLVPVDGHGDLMLLSTAYAIMDAQDEEPAHVGAKRITAWHDMAAVLVGDDVEFNGSHYIAMADPENPQVVVDLMSKSGHETLTLPDFFDYFAPGPPRDHDVVRPMRELVDAQPGQFFDLELNDHRVMIKVIEHNGNIFVYGVKGTKAGVVSLDKVLDHLRAAEAGGPASEVPVPVPSHIRSLEKNMQFATIPEIKQLEPGHLIWLTIRATRHPGTGACEGEDRTYAYAVGAQKDDGYNALMAIDPVKTPAFDSTRELMNQALDSSNRSEVVFKGAAGPGRITPDVIEEPNDIRIALPGSFQLIERMTGNIIPGTIKFRGEVPHFIKNDGHSYASLTRNIFARVGLIRSDEAMETSNALKYLNSRSTWLQRQEAGIVLAIEGEEYYFVPLQTIKECPGTQMLFALDDAGKLAPKRVLRTLNNKQAEIRRVIKNDEV